MQIDMFILLKYTEEQYILLVYKYYIKFDKIQAFAENKTKRHN